MAEFVQECHVPIHRSVGNLFPMVGLGLDREKYEKLMENLSEVSKPDIERAFYDAFYHVELEWLNRLAKRLNYTDEFVWNLSITKLKPEVFVEYIGRIVIPDNCIIDWPDYETYNVGKIVRLCLDHGINIEFRRSANDVTQVLCQTPDIKIYEFLLATYPEYQRLNPAHVYHYPFDIYSGISCSQTFLTMAICQCNIQCFPTILNTCPCFDEFNIYVDDDYMFCSDEISECSLEYSLDKSDIHLLVFGQILSEMADAHSDYKRLFDLILQIYHIRKKWFELTQNRCSRIQGWISCEDKLVNPRLTFLIWLSKLKPRGLPKLLMYQCIYKYIF